MPIVYVHGVAVRSDGYWPELSTYLRRYAARAISDQADAVPVIDAFWGDVGAKFTWNGLSCPEGQIFGMGAPGSPPSAAQQAELAVQLRPELRQVPVAPPAAGGLAAAGAGAAASAPATRLSQLSARELSDLLTTIVQVSLDDPAQQAQAAVLADEVAFDPATAPRLAAAANRDAELAELRQIVVEHNARRSRLAGQGGPPFWLQDLGDRLDEALSRSADATGALATRVLAEVRRPLHAFVTLFSGDVINYIGTRGTPEAPGEIPRRVLGKLAEARATPEAQAGEPLVVLSHSMGGQIVYDLVTYFLPSMPAYDGLRIDFWCTTASQVGLFEELQLFPGTRGKGYGPNNPVPLPDRRYLGGWWNVWDRNDFISYRAGGIIKDLVEESYDSGLWVKEAHGGYLKRPSFFREFAERLETAKAGGWGR